MPGLYDGRAGSTSAHNLHVARTSSGHRRSYAPAMDSPGLSAGTPATTVLVVEDEPLINQAVGDRLRAEGHHVVSAYDGPGAVAAFEEHGPALIVLDVMLPCTGWTYTRTPTGSLACGSRSTCSRAGWDWSCSPCSSPASGCAVRGCPGWRCSPGPPWCSVSRPSTPTPGSPSTTSSATRPPERST